MNCQLFSLLVSLQSENVTFNCKPIMSPPPLDRYYYLKEHECKNRQNYMLNSAIEL
jgi:hypothetical protein